MRVQSFPSKKGQSEVYTLDGSVKAEKLLTTVLTAVWSVASGTATISNQSLADNVASATITTPAEGCVLIKVLVTFSDGQHITPHFFKVKVLDPNCIQSGSQRY